MDSLFTVLLGYTQLTFICNTNLIVDNFNTKSVSGFVHVLTHFHSDHQPGLDKSFRGRIICSQYTADLVIGLLHVNVNFVDVLQIGVEQVISPPKDYRLSKYSITFIDANHCPGSVSVIIKGEGFAYYYMGDSRISSDVISDTRSIWPNPFDIVWIDSTFASDPLWDSMPLQQDSVHALIDFLRSKPYDKFALELEMLGTEIFIDAVLDAFPDECILVMGIERWNELEIIYGHDRKVMARLSLYGGDQLYCDAYRFVVQQRKYPTPRGFIRVRATTQRWASTVKEQTSFSIIHFDQSTCYVFFSIHSSKKEIDDFVIHVQCKKVVRLFKSIAVVPNVTTISNQINQVRREHVRRPFQFSNDHVWLESMADSQETVPSTIW